MEANVRKLLLLGAAAWLAFKGGKGMSRQAAGSARAAGPAAGLTFGTILSLLFMPRWMRPVALLRAVSANRRAPPRY
jgi:hypothetical protein